MPTVKTPEPTRYTVDIRHDGTQAPILRSDLPYVPRPDDLLVIDRKTYRVVRREWCLDVDDADTTPFVTVLVAPLIGDAPEAR